MKPAHAKLIVAGILASGAVMFGCFIGRMFFGLSHEHMLMGGGAAFVALLGLGMLANRLTYGVWIKRPDPAQRAVLDAGLKRARWGYFLGSLALLPIVFVLILLGVNSDIAMNLSVIAGALVAAFLLARHMMRQQRQSVGPN